MDVQGSCHGVVAGNAIQILLYGPQREPIWLGSWSHCSHYPSLPHFVCFLLGWGTPGKQGFRYQKERQQRVLGIEGTLAYKHPRVFKRQIKEKSCASLGGMFSQKIYSLPFSSDVWAPTALPFPLSFFLFSSFFPSLRCQ